MKRIKTNLFFTRIVRIVGGGIATLALLCVVTLSIPTVWLAVHAEQLLSSVTILPSLATTATGVIDYQSFALAPVSVIPRTAKAGAESVYEIEFSARKIIPIGGSVILYFPSGFSFLSSCATAPAIPENGDINGPAPGTVTIATISCTTTGYAITVTTAGARTAAGDMIRFVIQGVINSMEARGFETTGYSVGIEIRDTDGGSLDIKTALPFFLSPSGTQKIAGTVFNDNGAGLFGFARDGIQGGSEPGLAGVHVCLGGTAGSQCALTDTNGFYQFTKLNDGYYTVSVMTPSTDDVVGGPFFADVFLTGGQDRTGLNFAFAPAQRSITVTVSGIPSSTSIDVFAFGTGENGSSGGHVLRALAWNGLTARTVSLPVSDGLWSVGVGPSATALSSSFISPVAQAIRVSGNADYRASFVLQAQEKVIAGRIVDSVGAGIANAFVLARPSVMTSAASRKESTSVSLSDGRFEINVAPGSYVVEVSVPGMPPVPGIDVTVDTSGAMTSKGVAVTSVPVVIAKGERSISGRVLDESNNPIAYAYVYAEEIGESGNALGGFVDRPTDATGSFTLFVYDGIWKLRAVALSAGEISSKTVTIAGQSLSGQNLQAVTTNLGTVSGSVLKNGTGVSGAFVSVFNASGGGTTTTNASGQYSVRVPQGTGYTIDAHIANMGRIAPLEGVMVVAGKTLSGQNFSLQTSGTVVVTIDGVTDAFVDVRDTQFNGDGTMLNPTPGEYHITVPPGTYTVSAQNPLYGILGKRGGVVVQSGKTATVTFTPPSSFAVSGTLVSSVNACIVSASVYVVDLTNGRVAEAMTDDAGRYALQLSSGTYALTASKQGCIDAGVPTMITVATMSVTASPRTLTQAAAEVSGAVQLAGKNVTMETKVVARSATGTVQSTSVATANGSGSNYMLTLTPGTWTISARTDGYQSSEHTVAVAGGGKVLNIALAAIPGHIATERITTPMIPSQGGIVKNTDAGAKFAIMLPAGSLGSSSDSGSVSTKVTTAVVTKTATAEVIGGKGIEITPKDASGKPISTLTAGGTSATITLPYSKLAVSAAGTSETQLMLAVWSDDKQQWTPFATTIDTVSATLSGVPPHFSVFAPIVSVVAEASPPTPSPQESAPPRQASVIPTVGGTILVQPQNTQTAPRDTVEDSFIEPKVGEKNREKKSNQSEHTETEMRIIAQPLVVEQIIVQDVRRGEVKPTQFPVRPPPLFLQKPPQSAATFKEPPALFETSIAVDKRSRTIVESGNLVVRGEIIKSVTAQEEVPLHFVIRTAGGKVIAEQRDAIMAKDHAFFVKTFRLETIPEGHYRIEFEASYRGDIISSSDSFQVRQRILRPAELIAPSPSPAGERSLPFAVLGFLAALLVGGLIQLWYTLKRFTL